MDSGRRQRERLTLSFLLDSSADAALRTRQSLDMEVSDLQGVYIISVAARLLRMHPQTLRKYERMRLISPSRTVGMLRLYSEEDIAKLRMIKHLVEDRGMNLAGVEMALALVNQILAIRKTAEALLSRNQDAKAVILNQLEEILRMVRYPGVDQGGE